MQHRKNKKQLLDFVQQKYAGACFEKAPTNRWKKRKAEKLVSMQAVWCNPSLSQRSQINQGKTLFTPSLLAEIFTVAAQLNLPTPTPP